MGHSERELNSIYIAALDNEGLYSARGVARNARTIGLVPPLYVGKDLEEHVRSTAHAMVMRINRKIDAPPDGIDRTNPRDPRDAYLGIRWKSTIQERFLSEEDKVIVGRFKKDEAFRSLFIDRTSVESDHWRDTATLQSEIGKEKNGEIAHSGLRDWSKWGAFAFVSVLVFFLALPMNTFSPLSKIKRLGEDGNIEALRTMLHHPDMETLHGVILSTIADANRANGQTVFVANDMKGLCGVFAFKKNPLLLFDLRVVRLGDWVTLEGKSGYVSEINTEALIIKTETGTKEVEYPTLTLFGYKNWRATSVLIYPRPNNLSLVTNIMDIGLSLEQKGYQEISSGSMPNGTIIGSFHCDSYAELVELVGKDIGLSLSNNSLSFEYRPSSSLRTCIGFDQSFSLIYTNLGNVINEYERLLGVKFVSRPQLDYKRIVFPPMQLHDFISPRGLSVHMMSHNMIDLGDVR